MSDIAPVDPWVAFGDGLNEAVNGMTKAFAAVMDSITAAYKSLAEFLATYDAEAPKPGTWAYEVAEAVDVVLEEAEARFDQAIADLAKPVGTEHWANHRARVSIFDGEKWVKLA